MTLAHLIADSIAVENKARGLPDGALSDGVMTSSAAEQTTPAAIRVRPTAVAWAVRTLFQMMAANTQRSG